MFIRARIDVPLTLLLTRRAIAAMLDYGLYSLLLYVYLRNVGEQTDEGHWRATGLLPVLFAVLLWFALFPLTDAMFGRSPGKALLGLRIQDLRGCPATFLQHVRRRLLDPLELLPGWGLVAAIAVALTPGRQRIGDLWAKTRVIHAASEPRMPATDAV